MKVNVQLTARYVLPQICHYLIVAELHLFGIILQIASQNGTCLLSPIILNLLSYAIPFPSLSTHIQLNIYCIGLPFLLF